MIGNGHTARTQDVVAISFNRGLRGVSWMGNSTVIFDNSFRDVQISPDTQGQPHQEKINLQLCARRAKEPLERVVLGMID